MALPLLSNIAGWPTVSLEPDPASGYVLQVDSGGTPSTGVDEYWDGVIPWLTPKEVTAAGATIYVSQTERSITDVGLNSSAAKLLAVDSVLLTKRAPVGEVAINAVPMTTNQGFLNFACGPKLRPLYLAHWFRANKRYLNQVANGSTYRELYKSDLAELQIAVPPLAEQDAILSVVTSLQYITLLGLALEHSARSGAEMIAIQSQDRRLRRLCDSILVQLLSGGIRPTDITQHSFEDQSCPLILQR
jgi:type I restriction enzyme S subunit